MEIFSVFFPGGLLQMEVVGSLGVYRTTSVESYVLFGWFALKGEGPGLDGVCSIYQGHIFVQKKGHLCL